MRGIGPRKPLPVVRAVPPNLVDYFRCRVCEQWVYADDDRPCAGKVAYMSEGHLWRICQHHAAVAIIRCPLCGAWPTRATP